MIEENDWKQRALTPQILKETDSSYHAVIDLQHALEDENKCNIALTGPFGAGKSSVIQTLIEKERNNEKWKFLTISLATLDATSNIKQVQKEGTIKEDNVNGGINDSNNEQLNRRIEYSILQQLIYREKRETLPNSRLKRIPHIPQEVIRNTTLNILLFILCFCIVFEPQWCRVEILYRIFDWGYWANGIFDILALITMGVVSYHCISKLIAFSGNARLNQVTIAGSEIKIEDENSIFNHHLDEILYFFQCTTYNVVIIEDLDRFNTTDIFLKLRELNYLLNQSKIVGRKITFIYAIKDDMFADSSRTKFFDYITTVIPVISPFNSKEILRKALIALGHENEVNDDTIKEVAFFIGDMRLLQNIANEYHQYRLRLGCDDAHKIDNNKLLALIVYKNYYPNDFALLPKRGGKIYAALCPEIKKKYQDFAINSVLAKREELIKKKMEALNATRHLKAKELRMIYVMTYVNRLNAEINSAYKVNQIYDNNNVARPISYFWETEDAFDYFISQNRIQYRLTSGSSYFSNILFSNIEKNVNSNFTYQERINAINEGEDAINQEIANINLEKNIIRSYPVSTLMLKFSLYKEDFYKQINLPEMADRFIRIGFIAEDYDDYISYFYPGMITANDHTLILEMKLDKNPDYRAHIDNIKVLLEELPEDVFLTESIYNIELLDYLAVHPVTEKKHYDLFIYQLYNNNPFDFILIYYNEGKRADIVLKTYIQKNPFEIWNEIESKCKSDSQNIMKEIWLRYCSINHIKGQQIKWINTNFEFISSIYSKLSDDKKTFLTTKVNYTTLAETETNMLDSVITNECYQISKDTVPIVFKHKNAYDNVNLVTFEEQTLAFQLELPNPTWKNISIYYRNNEKEIDDSLWNFIQNKTHILCDFPYDGEPEMKDSIFQALMNSNKLIFEAYQCIGKSFRGNVFDLTEAEGLEEQRLCWLITNGYIEHSDENTSLIQNLSQKTIYEYIIYHESYFIFDVDKYIFTEKLAWLLLDTKELTNEQKALVLKNLYSTNITMTESLANAICKLLVAQYVELNSSLLKKALIKSSDKDMVLRIVINTIQNNQENNDLITELLQILPDPYCKIAEKGKRPTITITPLNEALLSLLKETKYISSYTSDETKFRVNTKQKDE